MIILEHFWKNLTPCSFVSPLFTFTNYTFEKGTLKGNCKRKAKQKSFSSNNVNVEAQEK